MEKETLYLDKKRYLKDSKPVFKKSGDIGILFIHGFTASPQQFITFSDGFYKEGYTISIPLLKGHGKDVKDLDGCFWYDWFEDVKIALFELRKTCKKIVVVGQSMGGTLALHVAAHYQIEGLVLLAPGMFLKRKISKIIPVVSLFK